MTDDRSKGKEEERHGISQDTVGNGLSASKDMLNYNPTTTYDNNKTTTEAPLLQTTTATNPDRRQTQGASYLEEQIQQFNKQ